MLYTTERIKMITVQTILRFKGSDVWSVTPQTSMLDALQLLKKKDVGALVVLENEKIAGIISERDLARQIADKGMCDVSRPVVEFMTKNVFTITPEHTIEDCMLMMTQKHIRHLPVLEKEKLVGIISIGDVVKEIISNQEVLINSLENYIEGRGYIR
jgi:CBS domain-containing protein